MMCREVTSIQSNMTIYNCEDGYEDKNVDAGIWIAIGIIITIVLFIVLLFVLRCHFRGPLKGSNNPAMLNDKTVAITGKSPHFVSSYDNFHILIHSITNGCQI